MPLHVSLEIVLASLEQQYYYETTPEARWETMKFTKCLPKVAGWPPRPCRI